MTKQDQIKKHHAAIRAAAKPTYDERRAAERKAAVERACGHVAFLKGVMLHLGANISPGWTIEHHVGDDPPATDYQLKQFCLRRDGQTTGLHVLYDPKKDRFEFSGVYGDGPLLAYKGHDEKPPKITASADREPDSVGRTIVRRLWDKYVTFHETLRKREAEMGAFEDERNALAAKLAKFTGALDAQGSNGYTVRPFVTGAGANGEIRVHSNRGAEFRITVPAKLAEAICKLIGKHNAKVQKEGE